MKALLAYVLAYLGPVDRAIRDHLNVREIVRIIIVTIVAGGGTAGVVSAVKDDLPAIVQPGDVVLAASVLTVIEEVRRRLNHGDVVKIKPMAIRGPWPDYPAA